ncbi:MAG: tetratricopeptide repeat protein [Candidatus Omnitrophota bacterium]|nr:tetratricopeptide repeat protein [Candidatus Omnitrophota bacterium]MDZ4242086.1 tetratricopeptide repeat protein [Candidatus Omnitrophota bacterium]
MHLKSQCLFLFLILAAIASGTPLLSPAAAAEPASADSKGKELFLVAQKAFEDGFYDVAMRYIDQFLKEYPKSEKRVQAQLLLGQCYFFKSQYLKAFDTFQGLLQYPEYKDATLFWLGETYFKGSDYKQAEKQYQELIDLYPESIYLPQAYYSLAWAHFEDGNFDEAKKNFQRMMKRFPAHQLAEDAAFKLGECAYNLGAYENAVEYFKNYVLKYPPSNRHADAYFYIAESYYYMEDYLTAVTYYAKTADIAYGAKVVYLSDVSMGWSYLKLKKYDLAQKYFDEALAVAKEKNLLTDDYYLGQASLHAQQGENDKAVAAYATLVEQFPNSPRIADAYLGKANINYAQKNFPQAILEYQTIIDTYANDATKADIVEKAYYGLAWTHLKSGNVDASIRTFEKIMNTTKSKVVKISALTQIGDAYQDINQLEKAIDIYDVILRDYPDNVFNDYVQFRQGIALLKLNKLEAATLSLQSLQANFSNSKYLKEGKYYLGVAYFKKKDWNNTIAYIQDFLEGLPAGNEFASEARYLLGQSYFNLEQYDKSLQVFRHILQVYPEETNIVMVAEFNSAKCLYQMGQPEEAVKTFQKVYQSYPGAELAQNSLIWLGDYALEQGNTEGAVQSYEEFLTQFPGSPKLNLVRYQLGQAFLRQENVEKALEQYKLISPAPDMEIYAKARLAIADILSQKMDEPTAVQTYQSVIETVPEFKRDAYVKMAELYAANKNTDKTIESYKSALAADRGLSAMTNAEIQFRIADMYELQNDTARALDEYFKIPSLYLPETAWVVKAYLRMARIYEDQEGWEEAATTYRKIQDLKTEEAKYAQERLDWIQENIFKTSPR